MLISEGLVTIPSPWDRINIFSKLTFSWVWSLFIRAHKRDLNFSDVYRCSKSDETHLVRHKLEIKWDKQLKSKRKPSLCWALMTSFGPELIVCYIPDTIRELGLNLFQAYCTTYLVRYFNNDPNTSQWWAQWAAVVGVRIRAACCALIYRKITRRCYTLTTIRVMLKKKNYHRLSIVHRISISPIDIDNTHSMRLSHSSLGQTTVGQILNIMSNDVHRFDEFAIISRSLFTAPLQAAIVLYLLWPYLRWACLAGMTVLVLFIPFQALMGRLFRNIRLKTAKITDSRIRLMQEIIAGMRVIKMYAWEQPFAQLVATARKSEVKQIRWSNFLKGVNQSINFVLIRVIIYVCFLTYVLTGGLLSAVTAFATIAYFDALRINIGKNAPMAVAALGEIIVVIKRMQDFLLLEEMSGLDEREGKDNEAFISGENELILGVMENTSSNEEKSVFMDKMIVRWNNALMCRLFSNIRQKTAKLTDSRIRLMREIITGMRVIKMYAWEQPFALLVATARKSEVKQIRWSNFLKGINQSIDFVIIRVIIYACFLTYVLMGRMLSAETAFAIIAYFDAMRITIGTNAPRAVAALGEIIPVIKRMQDFLLLEEMSGLDEREGKDNEAFISGENEIILGVMENTSSNEEKGVFMDKMSVRWNNETTEPTLRDISLSVKPGQLLGVVGAVGSGKSSLLMAILNEISLVSGRVVVRGRVSYAPQESWAFIASVRQNILFGSQYNEEKYNRVVKACALDTDFKLMPFGDKTLVGERGLALSGGQKARLRTVV
ncbi:unnamed protein product [Medioppia subpectinata]|uniref:ABC transmembrane type-1 domain-containing protein n=1 Tax=Medioppia subpectinata TaxID=1979941 RepID=A0A7R9KFY4_9ACAR|nr:unnamed protein product [Medioppia subpectinata]CAG2102834.1 unnamed protein product [Medioppia subpectinata]